MKKLHKDVLNGECQDAHHFLLSLIGSTSTMLHVNSISGELRSQIVSSVTCNECGDVSTQSTEYFVVPIDIIQTSHIGQAFNMFFGKETVHKFCAKCEKNVSAVKQFKLISTPSVLCLQIKRLSAATEKNKCVEIGATSLFQMRCNRRLAERNTS